jgi:hypothetical protein
MRLRMWIGMAVTVVLSVTPACTFAWDCLYDGSVMPNDPWLGRSAWTATGDLSGCSSDGSVLKVAGTFVSFSRSAAPAKSPLTLEARLRVAQGSRAALYAGTPSRAVEADLYSDRVVLYLPTTVTYYADLTCFRTLTIAVAGEGGYYASYVWLDGLLVAQGTAGYGNSPNAIFGLPWGSGVSYWDYVAYSIPEPSCFLAVVAALAGSGAMVRRRRRVGFGISAALKSRNTGNIGRLAD